MIKEIIEHAEKEIKKCPYCASKGSSEELYYFSGSKAFKADDGIWYHFHLLAPTEHSKGGYDWQECRKPTHNEYLSLATGNLYTWQKAEKDHEISNT